MELHYCRSQTKEELLQILALQQKNLFSNTSLDIQEKEGFVTVHHTFDILHQMNQAFAHIIAKDGNKVVGYALCMHSKFALEIEVLKPMFKEMSLVLPKNTAFMVMGQICIDTTYRKKGVFRKLYEAMETAVRPEFSSIITEVDAKNTRSLNAHYAIGFKDLKTYWSKGQKWRLLILKLMEDF